MVHGAQHFGQFSSHYYTPEQIAIMELAQDMQVLIKNQEQLSNENLKLKEALEVLADGVDACMDHIQQLAIYVGREDNE